MYRKAKCDAVPSIPRGTFLLTVVCCAYSGFVFGFVLVALSQTRPQARSRAAANAWLFSSWTELPHRLS